MCLRYLKAIDKQYGVGYSMQCVVWCALSIQGCSMISKGSCLQTNYYSQHAHTNSMVCIYIEEGICYVADELCTRYNVYTSFPWYMYMYMYTVCVWTV